MITLRDGSQVKDPRFGRLEEWDDDSWGYPFRETLRTAVKPQKRYWCPGPVLNQGKEGACVGFAWAGELVCAPQGDRGAAIDMVEALALEIYHDAQRNDPWPGGAYPGASPRYEGTSVLAGAKEVQKRGYIGEYRWCFSVEEMRDAVIVEGPVIIGIEWREGMYETRPSGLVEVTGDVVGGHAILVDGYNPKARLKGESGYHEIFRWRNSWGMEYGVGGHGYVKIEEMAALLAARGEVCVPMTRSAVRIR